MLTQDIKFNVVIGPAYGNRRCLTVRQGHFMPGGNVGALGGPVTVNQAAGGLFQPGSQPFQVDGFAPQEHITQ